MAPKEPAGRSTLSNSPRSESSLRLHRSLKLKDLVFYGIVVMSPMAPMGVFGVLSGIGGGHVVTSILIALVPMLFTSISYGRMARAYPSAGSAFTYIAQEIHPSIGFVIGWAILLDYFLNVIQITIWGAQASHEFTPEVSVSVWKIFYAVAFTLLNIQAIRSSARINILLTVSMGVVVIMIFVAAAHYILGRPNADPVLFTRPFYDAHTFTYARLLGSTSLAIFTYIGFDAISTLAEETENPRRNVLVATVLVCVIIGLLSAAESYVGQLVWPASEKFPDIDTAYLWIVGRIWKPLFTVVGLTLLIANFGAGVTSHLGSARLLYAMGRSNALPRRFFGAIDPKHHVPRNNVLAIGAVVSIGAFVFSFELAVETLNFGALIAFMGVNAAAFMRYVVRERHKKAWTFMIPALGFLICLTLWWNLSLSAKVFGSIWMAIGIAFASWRTKGFRMPLSLEEPGD